MTHPDQPDASGVTGDAVHAIAVAGADLVVTTAATTETDTLAAADGLARFVTEHLHTPDLTRYGAIAFASVTAVGLDPEEIHSGSCSCGQHGVQVAYYAPPDDDHPNPTRVPADDVDEPYRTIGRLIAASVASDDDAAEALLLAVPDTALPELLTTLFGIAVTVVRQSLQETRS